MIDTVTVVFEPELDVLKWQAQSLDLFVDDIDNVFVIVNQDQDLTSQIQQAWWGRYQDRVRIIPRSHFGSVWADHGWVSQQALKLLAAAVSTNPWAVILDAKTIFVKPFAELDPRPAVGQLDIYPVFEPSRHIANQLFGIDLQQQLGPGGVPFIISPDQTRDMLSWIQTRTGQAFAEWFQQQGRLTEFILYSAWIQYRTGSLDQVYDVQQNKIIPCNLCHSEVGLFEHKLKRMPDSNTVSIHRDAWRQLSASQQQQYTDFLHSRGIQ